MTPGNTTVQALESSKRQQRWRRQCGAEGDNPGLDAGLQHAHQALADIDRYCFLRGRADARLRSSCRRMTNEIPGLRPCFDKTSVFQLAQCLQHRRHGQPPLARQTPHRRQTLARPQIAGSDNPAQILRQPFVTQEFNFIIHRIHRIHRKGCCRKRPDYPPVLRQIRILTRNKPQHQRPFPRQQAEGCSRTPERAPQPLSPRSSDIQRSTGTP